MTAPDFKAQATLFIDQHCLHSAHDDISTGNLASMLRSAYAAGQVDERRACKTVADGFHLSARYTDESVSIRYAAECAKEIAAAIGARGEK